MVTADQKKEWLVLLRSGKYKQGKGYLRLGNFYCCLGVLGESLCLLTPEEPELGGTAPMWRSSDGASWLPEEVLPSYVQKKLSELNDDNEANFLEIADWIEKNVYTQEEIKEAKDSVWPK